MKIWGKITGGVAKAENQAYQCWMCNKEHDSPADFLWHINAHKLEMAGPQALLVTRERAMEAEHLVSR